MLISIIFGLALTHVLSGAVRSVYAGFSTETHLVYAAFFIQVLLLNWWVFFKWHTELEWSFDRFLILTLWAMTHYVMAVSVYPPGQAEVDDDRRSSWFLWAFIAVAFADITITSMRGDLFRPWFYLPFVLHYVVLSLVAITVNTPTIHRFTSWWFLSITVIWALVVRRLLS